MGSFGAGHGIADWSVRSVSRAFAAVEEFIRTDGELPTAIDWISGEEIPADAFPR